MGIMIDTNVFIQFEAARRDIDLSRWTATEPVYASVLTISELLMGVHRANTQERRQRRSAFVESIIARVGVLNFTLSSARLHAKIYADLAKQGQMIGAHDLIIAATAVDYDMPILTDNVAEFTRVAGLRVLPFQP